MFLQINQLTKPLVSPLNLIPLKIRPCFLNPNQKNRSYLQQVLRHTDFAGMILYLQLDNMVVICKNQNFSIKAYVGDAENLWL